MLKLSRLLWVLLLVGAFVALGNGRAEATTGLASWYGPGLEGAPTASGDVFDPSAFTAAHKTLPFGTQVTVSYRGRATQVTVNDRGPYTGAGISTSPRAQQIIWASRGPGWIMLTTR